MTIPSFDATETECVKNCLFKFNAVERLMIEKMRQVMEGMNCWRPRFEKSLSQPKQPKIVKLTSD
jgi:hypothetical protein